MGKNFLHSNPWPLDPLNPICNTMQKTNDIIKIIHSLVPHDRKLKIMNVCGSHEHTISFSGMRSLMPDNLELIPGPGCPVCVCPESDIINAINLSILQQFHKMETVSDQIYIQKK